MIRAASSANMDAMLRAPPLGRLLLDTGVLTQQALDEVLAAQKNEPRRLGELLVDRGLVKPQQLAQLLSRQLSCPWVSLQRMDIPPTMLSLVPREIAVACHVVPIHLRVSNGAKILYVATDDPTDEAALKECERAAGMRVRPMIAVTTEVSAALTRFYGVRGRAASKFDEQEAGSALKPKPPLPKPKAPGRATLPDIPASVAVRPPQALEEVVEDVELLPASEKPKIPPRTPKVLALNAPETFLAQCKEAATALGATVVSGDLASAAAHVDQHKPCALVLTEEVYATDRAGLNRVALDGDAALVVWSDDAEGKQLKPLLDGAIKRWRRSSYEKGSLVESRYELLRDLGGRIGGSRWEVRHARTLRRSVLKIGVRSSGDEDDAAAVEREQNALARVHHPAAVDLRDAGATELGDPYIVVELVEGKTVEGLVVAREKLPPWDVCSVFHQVADCLSLAHAASVAHGDVTAENVVVLRDGYGSERAKLVNWESATTGANEEAIRADVRAVGEALFHALVGRRRASTEDPATALVESGIGPTLAGVVARAVGTDPDAKFSTMKDLVAALEIAEPRSRDATHLLDAFRRERREPKVALQAPAAPATATDPQKSSGADSRRFARAPYRTPIRVEVPGIGAVDGRTEDVSCGGLFIVTRAEIDKGAQVTVRFALPGDGQIVSETGKVRWSRAAGGESAVAAGIEFDAAGAETRKQIEHYVALMAEDSSESTS